VIVTPNQPTAASAGRSSGSELAAKSIEAFHHLPSICFRHETETLREGIARIFPMVRRRQKPTVSGLTAPVLNQSVDDPGALGTCRHETETSRAAKTSA
jgi:hypothetical protein